MELEAGVFPEQLWRSLHLTPYRLEVPRAFYFDDALPSLQAGCTRLLSGYAACSSGREDADDALVGAPEEGLRGKQRGGRGLGARGGPLGKGKRQRGGPHAAGAATTPFDVDDLDSGPAADDALAAFSVIWGGAKARSKRPGDRRGDGWQRLAARFAEELDPALQSDGSGEGLQHKDCWEASLVPDSCEQLQQKPTSDKAVPGRQLSAAALAVKLAAAAAGGEKGGSPQQQPAAPSSATSSQQAFPVSPAVSGSPPHVSPAIQVAW